MSLSTDDAATGINSIGDVSSNTRAVIADGAYDTRAFYASVESKGVRVSVPPDTTAAIISSRIGCDRFRRP